MNANQTDKQTQREICKYIGFINNYTNPTSSWDHQQHEKNGMNTDSLMNINRNKNSRSYLNNEQRKCIDRKHMDHKGKKKMSWEFDD